MSNQNPLLKKDELHARLLKAKDDIERIKIVEDLKKQYADNVDMMFLINAVLIEGQFLTRKAITENVAVAQKQTKDAEDTPAVIAQRFFACFGYLEIKATRDFGLGNLTTFIRTFRIPKVVFQESQLTCDEYREIFSALRQNQHQMLVVFRDVTLNNETVEMLLNILIHDNPNPPDIKFLSCHTNIEAIQKIRQALNKTCHDSIDNFTVWGNLSEGSRSQTVQLSLNFFPRLRIQAHHSHTNNKRKASAEIGRENTLIPIRNEVKCKSELENFGPDIYTMLQDNPSLTYLNLNQHCVGSINNLNLLVTIGRVTAMNFCHITNLTLRHLNINASQCEMIANALRTNHTLTSLSLQDNCIGTRGAKALADCLRQPRQASHQSTSFIPSQSQQAIKPHNSTIQCLDIESNQIGDEGLAALAHMLICNSSLTSLYCLFDWRNPEVVAHRLFAEALQHNRTLTILNLEYQNEETREALARNEQIQIRTTQNWSRIAPLISFVRANNGNPLCTSVLPLLPYFTMLNQWDPRQTFYDPSATADVEQLRCRLLNQLGITFTGRPSQY